MKRGLGIVAAFLIAGSSAMYAADLGTLIDNAGLEALKSGTQRIDFQLDNLQGAPTKLSTYGGKVVVLNFWATWCGPCRSEMPSLETLYQRYKADGLVVVGVNLEERSSDVKAFVKENNITFPVLLDASGRVGLTYGARSIPVTYVIDKKGFVTSGGIGAREWMTPDMQALFEALLGQ
jgi:peroxiredoxin